MERHREGFFLILCYSEGISCKFNLPKGWRKMQREGNSKVTFGEDRSQALSMIFPEVESVVETRGVF